MTNTHTPEDGDFAALLEGRSSPSQARRHTAGAGDVPEPGAHQPTAGQPQTPEDVVAQQAQQIAERIEELDALQSAEPLSDEELERQALQHPGNDGDPNTPE